MSQVIVKPLVFTADTLKYVLAILRHTLLSLRRFLFPRKKSLRGETVLITGASGGLGRLMALRFAKLGVDALVLWDINEEGLKRVADEVRSSQSATQVYVYVCDLSKRTDIYEKAAQVKKDVGAVTILVNNAGIVTGKKFLDCSDSLVEKTIAVNAMAPIWATKIFLPDMIEKNHGHIVNIASCAGIVGTAGLADYCASKAALVMFDESIRVELKKQKKFGVHTTCVNPYYINTGMFDGVKTKYDFILPIMEPEYVVDKIMHAVLVNQEVLILPRFNYLAYLFRFMFSTALFDESLDYLGISKSMDEFRGSIATTTTTTTGTTTAH